jgi:Flp pilus assembly pilin Flp
MLRGLSVRFSGLFWRAQRAQAMVEYALILVLIAVVVLVALGALGTGIVSAFGKIVSKLG